MKQFFIMTVLLVTLPCLSIAYEVSYENPKLRGLLISAGFGFNGNLDSVGLIYKKLSMEQIATRVCKKKTKDINAVSSFWRIEQGNDNTSFYKTLAMIDGNGKIFDQKFRRHVYESPIRDKLSDKIIGYKNVNKSYKYFIYLICETSLQLVKNVKDGRQGNDLCVTEYCADKNFDQYTPLSSESTRDDVNEVYSKLVQNKISTEQEYSNPKLRGLLIAAGSGFNGNLDPAGLIYEKLSPQQIANRACKKKTKSKGATCSFWRIEQGNDGTSFYKTLAMIDGNGRMFDQKFRRHVYESPIRDKRSDKIVGYKDVNKSYKYFSYLACVKK